MNFKNFNNRKKSAFTLMELLIVIALIALIAAGLLILINPMQQFAKSHDAKRKFELDALRRAFEEYYNDKGCYPKPEEVCYNTPKNYCTGAGQRWRAQGKICNICGLETPPPAFAAFAPYLSKLPCDPEHPRKDYLYQVPVSSCSQTTSCDDSYCQDYCSSWYRIYSEFSIDNDQDSINLGCIKNACGLANPPAPTTVPYGYDYGVSSPNVGLEFSTKYNCLTRKVPSYTCNACGLYQYCLTSEGCIDKDKIYSTCTACCQKTGYCDPSLCAN